MLMAAMLMVSVMLSAKDKKQQYVATWTTAIQKVEPHNLAPAPYLSGNSLRQIVEVSFGGKEVALKLSNEFNTEETEILGVELAEAASQGASSDIKGSSTPLSFNGMRGVTMKPGEVIVSDPVPFKLRPRMNVAITIHFGKASQTDVTGHPGSRTSSYIAKGNTKNFKDAVETAHWYYINSLLVVAPQGKFGSIAAIGNSIKYSETMPPDFSVVLLKDYMYIEPEYRQKLMLVPEFVKWMQSKGKLLNGSIK